jgi:hypothetical protein
MSWIPPISLAEKMESPIITDGESPSIKRKMTMEGVPYETMAHSLAISATPPTEFLGSRLLVRKSVSLSAIGFHIWDVDIDYGLQSHEKETGSNAMRFEIATQETTIKQALEHIADYAPAGETATDYKGAIGVNQDGEAEGTQVITPTFSFTEELEMSDADINPTYVSTLYQLCGTVNNASWSAKYGTFEAGELLFAGCSGQKSSEDTWSMSFSFMAEPNVTGQTFGDIAGIDKQGFDYIWFEFRPQVDATAKRIVTPASDAHVERVYKRKDFSLLGIR